MPNSNLTEDVVLLACKKLFNSHNYFELIELSESVFRTSYGCFTETDIR